MAITLGKARRAALPGALISLLLGLAATGIIIIAIQWLSQSSIVAYLNRSLKAPETPGIPLALLIAAAAGFLLGLVGLVIGCSCLPNGTGEARSRLCTWFAGAGIGFSLVTMLTDFMLISLLRLFLPVP
jgi:hypothetical protein